MSKGPVTPGGSPPGEEVAQVNTILDRVRHGRWQALALSDVPEEIHSAYVPDRDCEHVLVRRKGPELQIMVVFDKHDRDLWVLRGRYWERAQA